MAEIIKVYKESFPALRLIGKRYSNKDMINGSFGHLWGKWFELGWFDELEKLGQVKGLENGYLGFMRNHPDQEYWIGIFLPPDTAAPAGYSYIDMPAAEVAICWIKAKEDDYTIYTMHEQCFQKCQENNFSNFMKAPDNSPYTFERYNSPRFTNKDEQNNIILDFGIYLD